MNPPFPESEYGSYMADIKAKYEEALEAFPSPDPPDEYKHLPALGQSIVHTTLLEEFIFWTFKFEFPQNIVCFLLNMLPDQDYKVIYVFIYINELISYSLFLSYPIV